jgi:hypothetical protein
MVDELVVARQLISVLEKRVRLVKQRRPEWTPSQREHYILKLPNLTAKPVTLAAMATSTEPVTGLARLGSDAAFVVQKILLVGDAPLFEDEGFSYAANLPFFDIIDRSSGGRSLVHSQQGSTSNNRMPITHFANTLPVGSRGASYSAFTLFSEYLLPRGAVVEGRLFRNRSVECRLIIALAGYKVYG